MKEEIFLILNDDWVLELCTSTRHIELAARERRGHFCLWLKLLGLCIPTQRPCEAHQEGEDSPPNPQT